MLGCSACQAVTSGDCGGHVLPVVLLPTLHSTIGMKTSDLAKLPVGSIEWRLERQVILWLQELQEYRCPKGGFQWTLDPDDLKVPVSPIRKLPFGSSSTQGD